MRVLYENARLIDADTDTLGCLVTDGAAISAVLPANSHADHDRRVNAAGLCLSPALIDLHCHLRDPGYPQKETMETGMRAALSGGYGTLVAMANTKPVCDTAALVTANHQKAKALGLCNLIQAAAAGIGLTDETPADYAALSRVTNVITNDGNTIYDDGFMRQLLLASREYGFVISTHCQPERSTIARDLALLKETGGRLHVGHISTKQSVEMIRAAKERGLPVTCEVTPHHLFGWDSDYRVNPPLRSREDVLALIAGIKDGTVDCLSTDHAPHTPEDKKQGMAGISNIEHALQIFLTVFAQNDIPLTRLMEMATKDPASILGLPVPLLQAGCPADLILYDPCTPSKLDPDAMRSRSHNTPFSGRAVQGRVLQTILGGTLRYEYGTTGC